MTKNNGFKGENDTDKPSEFRKITKSYTSGWIYAEYAFQYGVSIILCSLIGYWIDNKFDTGYIFLIIGVILGSFGGFINLLKGLSEGKKNLKNGKNIR